MGCNWCFSAMEINFNLTQPVWVATNKLFALVDGLRISI
jgi:hypothetical protein